MGLLLESLCFLAVISLAKFQHSDQDSLCGPGWTPYKDECITIARGNNPRKKVDAIKMCRKKATENNDVPRLITIKNEDKQRFLERFIFEENPEYVDSVWLGLDIAGDTFRWNDMEALNYTNWDIMPDGTRQIDLYSKEHYIASQDVQDRAGVSLNCVEMISGKRSNHQTGKWRRVNCESSNIVVCEKKPTLSLAFLQNMLSNHTNDFYKYQLTVNGSIKQIQDVADQAFKDIKQTAEKDKEDVSKKTDQKLTEANKEILEILEKTKADIHTTRQDLNYTRGDLLKANEMIGETSKEVAAVRNNVNYTREELLKANEAISNDLAKANQELATVKNDLNYTREELLRANEAISKDRNLANSNIAAISNDIAETRSELLKANEAINKVEEKANQIATVMSDLNKTRDELLKANEAISEVRNQASKNMDDVKSEASKNLLEVQDTINRVKTEAKQALALEKEHLDKKITQGNQFTVLANYKIEHEIKDVTKDLRKEITDAIASLKKLDQELCTLKQNPVPIGFIYIQLPKQKNPQEIWGEKMKWHKISNNFKNLPIKASGKTATYFGKGLDEHTGNIEFVQDSGNNDDSESGSGVKANLADNSGTMFSVRMGTAFNKVTEVWKRVE